MTPPREVLSRLLLAFLGSNELQLGAQPAGQLPTQRLIRLTLAGLSAVPARLVHAAAAVVGLSQACSPPCCMHDYSRGRSLQGQELLSSCITPELLLARRLAKILISIQSQRLQE